MVPLYNGRKKMQISLQVHLIRYYEVAVVSISVDHTDAVMRPY